MAQHDYVIANQGFPAFRSDLNDALAAIVSNNSGATEPTTMFAHQMWVDTAANPSILKMRNADNDAWVTLGRIDQTNDRFVLVGPQYFNRLSTDGDVAIIQKDGATVGGIATFGGRIVFADSPSGVTIDDAANTFRPINASNGGARDGATDLGDANNRWKSLYLSGSVYLGGTGAANALDDYEEGTWTPTVTGGTTAGTTTYTTQNGTYRKIGRLVTATFKVAYSAATGTGTLSVASFPFAATAGEHVGSIMFDNLNMPSAGSYALYLSATQTQAQIYTSVDDGAIVGAQLSNESVTIWATITYFTT